MGLGSDPMAALDPGEFGGTAIRRLAAGAGPHAQGGDGRMKAGFAFLPRIVLRAAGTVFVTAICDMSGHFGDRKSVV